MGYSQCSHYRFPFAPPPRPEGVFIGNSDVDRQLLEASKSGDLETVKVNGAETSLPPAVCLPAGGATAGCGCKDLLPSPPPTQKLCTLQNVNCRDVEGRQSTPLHFAAGYNRVSVVDYLLQHGADVHAKDKGYGHSPICKYGGQIQAK